MHRQTSSSFNLTTRLARQVPTAQSSKFAYISMGISEARAIANISLPMILTGLLLYSRSMISMLFLCGLGELSLAGGVHAIMFANNTGYSILSGLAMGMEPICGLAFGAKKHTLLGLSLQRTVLLLLSVSFPIALLWSNMKRTLLFIGQDANVAEEAQSYILFSLPDLLAMSFLHPLHIYLQTQSITLPLTYCSMFSLLLQLPINYLLVSVLGLGVRGVALGSVLTNFSLVAFLIIYISFSGVYKKTRSGISTERLKGWNCFLNLAISRCISVCQEWWPDETMLPLCGLLLNPRDSVASMRIPIQTATPIRVLPSSLSYAVLTRVSNELGANRPKKARLAAILGVACSFALGFLAFLFAIMVQKTWATIFSSDTYILTWTSSMMPIIGLCKLCSCPQKTMCSVLRGTAQPRTCANINLGSFYIVGMPVAVHLAFWAGYDFKGMLFGLMEGRYTCAVLMLIVLGFTDWELQAEKARMLIEADVVAEEG